MLSEALLHEICGAAPLSPIFLREAWPSLLTESIEIIRAAEKNKSPHNLQLVDLALADSAAVVRAFAARLHWFQTQDSMTSAERETELARIQLIQKDPSAFVREAALARGNIGLLFLDQVPQLSRLIRIRNLDRSDGEGLATFIEKGLSTGSVPLPEMRECLLEYFEGEAFRADSRAPEPRGIYDASPSVAWNRLWALAATVPEEISRELACRLPLESKAWSVSQDLLHALPNGVKEILVFRDGGPVEELRRTLLKSPKEHDADLVHSAARYYSFVVDEGGGPIPEDERAEAELTLTPYRQKAAFEAVQRLRGRVEEQSKLIEGIKESVGSQIRRLVITVRVVGCRSGPFGCHNSSPIARQKNGAARLSVNIG